MAQRNSITIIDGKAKFALRYFSNNTSKPTIFCFPFMGGSSTAFKPISQYINGKANIVSIDPPGHGTVNGKLICDIDDIVDIYYEGIIKHLTKDFYMFGHSLGGIIAYLLSVKLEKNGFSPKGIFISGTPAPNVILKEIEEDNSDLTYEEIKEYLMELGGKHSELAKSNSIFLYSYMKVIRADYKVFKSLKTANGLFLKSPSYIIFSEDDEYVSSEKMSCWINFCNKLEFIKVEGRHNYIIEESEKIVEIIINKINLNSGDRFEITRSWTEI